MPTRVQSLIYALGMNKQSNISTIASSFARWRKLNLDVHTLEYRTETDAAEIGKGNEFISEVFPVAYDIGGRIEKYGSAKFTIWAWAYGLGIAAYSAPTY